jgi:hypothetical protein
VTVAPADAGGSIALLRARFERLARVECAVRSPLYAAICRALADDANALELVLCAPAAQRRPTLLLAAIHDLLLGGVEHELRAHVPTVAGGRAARDDPGALAVAFCREHRDALARVLATRTTQTNEVNRTAALLPALVHATPAGARLRLVELGASAGLNLLLDRYEHRYPDGSGADLGTLASETRSTPRVVCECEVAGEPPAIDPPPVIAERIGVDVDPIDVRDPPAARWLLACTWPDEADRVARLRAAIELARRDPPVVMRGDALALLGDLADGGCDDVHPVIWHSWVLAYWSRERRRALSAAIDAIGARRDLTWIYLEQPSETPGLPAPVVAGAAHERHDSALVAVRYRAGERTVQRLADAHPHVHRMRWLADR